MHIQTGLQVLDQMLRLQVALVLNTAHESLALGKNSLDTNIN